MEAAMARTEDVPQATIRDWIATERRELAAVLLGLPEERWDEATLCAGWRVREVVAHMTMQYRYSTPHWLFELVKSGFRMNRMLDDRARHDAGAVPYGALAALLRDNAEHPWKPPGGGYEGALTHDVVHGLDFTVPLGVGRRVPEAPLRAVLTGLGSAKGLKWFGVDLDGVALRADDMEWSFGSGAPMTGAAQDLVMVLTGRLLPSGHLSGEPAARYTAVASPSTA
jgi:uncharacterized protein (TIGR03083 family)